MLQSLSQWSLSMAESPFRCPESTCIGWVSQVEDDDETFWGCGECGTVWSDSDELSEAIDGAIEKHPYRKKCYRKTRSKWNPVPLDKQPDDYEELVEQEWDDAEEAGEADDLGEEEYPYGVDESCYRCPVSQCSGWVCWTEEGGFDGDKPAWECGYCGSTWYDKKNLLNEIEVITEAFAYRQRCYVRSKQGWDPAPIAQHPPDYDDQVEDEPEDTLGDSDRG